MLPDATSLPVFITETVSQSLSATSRTWVEKNTAHPESHILRIMVFRTWVDSGSSPTNGSSRIRSLGLCERAPIIASFCFMPWL